MSLKSIKLLNYQILTLKVSKDIFLDVVDFYLKKLNFDMMFEDDKIQISEFQFHNGFYLRIEGIDKDSSTFFGDHLIISFAVPKIQDAYQLFSKEDIQISPIKTIKNMESYFEITDPAGFSIRYSEFDHGPAEWRESLDDYLSTVKNES